MMGAPGGLSGQCCGSGMFIPDPGFFPSRIPDPGSQKTWGGKKIFFYICFLTFLQLSTLAETDLDS
jgi:hypothetical protein